MINDTESLQKSETIETHFHCFQFQVQATLTLTNSKNLRDLLERICWPPAHVKSDAYISRKKEQAKEIAPGRRDKRLIIFGCVLRRNYDREQIFAFLREYNAVIKHEHIGFGHWVHLASVKMRFPELETPHSVRLQLSTIAEIRDMFVSFRRTKQTPFPMTSSYYRIR